MNGNKIYKIISLINILFTLTIILDNFLLLPKNNIEILQNKTVEKTRFLRTRSYETFFLISNFNIKYNVPVSWFNKIESGDQFVIQRTKLFKKAIRIGLKSENKITNENIGMFNSSLFGNFIIAIILIFSFLVLLFPFSLKRQYLVARFTLNATLISIIVVIFYFYYQA